MTLVELKAAAYDTLVQIQALQQRLAQINQAIAKEAKEKPSEEV
jgi:hypothetical protein